MKHIDWMLLVEEVDDNDDEDDDDAVCCILSSSSMISSDAMIPLGSINSVVLALVTMEVQVRKIDVVRTVVADKQLADTDDKKSFDILLYTISPS